ncbi:unnamed protein product [Brachionus calyciflorus]|uniref:Acyltransferase 3 domain-containing protein n=1 Tax=Brachionus calyciflorus TaxID=104777 RepID=A0A814KIM9_9BILA|nr:unnamed protein product [Brachionus calyciflorus]
MMVLNENPNDKKINFDFLTGFRGLLALLVLLHHASYDLKLKGDYELFKGIGYYVGVIGFFVLSSFLLTHRLIIDLEMSFSLKNISNVILKFLWSPIRNDDFILNLVRVFFSQQAEIKFLTKKYLVEHIISYYISYDFKTQLNFKNQCFISQVSSSSKIKYFILDFNLD